MIVNKEVFENHQTGQKYLLVSYVDKDGQIKFLQYPLSQDQFFSWVYTTRAYADPIWKSYDNKWVKKVQAKTLNEFRMNEILNSLGDQILPIYDLNYPETWFCDIETDVDDEGFCEPDEARNPVNTIALTKWPKTIVWGRKPLSDNEISWIKQQYIDHKDSYVRGYQFEYKYFANEADMLMDFFKFIMPIPHVTGWNFLGYDWLYLYTRAVSQLGMNIDFLSPTRKFYNYKVSTKISTRNVMLPMHKIVSDYLMMYQKWDRFVKVKENNTLDFVASSVLGYKKVQHNLGFDEFYKKEYAKYVFYNSMDTILVEQIDKKINTAKIWYSLTSELRTELMMQFSTIKPTEVVLCNFCYPEHKVIPIKKKNPDIGNTDYEGAFVWPSQQGVYKEIGGLDFSSLYPTTIRQFNISPETLLKVDRTGTYIPSPSEIKCTSGAVYDNSYEGLVPRVLTHFFQERKNSKKKRKEVDSELEDLKHILEKREKELKKNSISI